jgi:hypothetical protein
MENLGTQLELDFGMLTVGQQETVDRFVKYSNRETIRRKEESNNTEALLVQGGFQAGIDYVNTLETKTVTEIKEFGYGDDEFTAEVTYDKVVGDVKIISDYYNGGSNKLEVRKVYLSRSGDKLECFTITGTFRAYKPSTLLSKLNSYNEGQKDTFKRVNKQKIVLNHTIEKYKTMYPDADVKAGTDYNRQTRGYTTFPIVTVKFKSGSYIAFRLGHEVDQEFIHKKFDAVANNMSVTEVLEMFNNQ